MLQLEKDKPVQLSDIFSALGDANRLKIIKLLASDRDLCVSEVASEVGITVAGISQHMKILEKAGLVVPQRKGQKICYRINGNRENQAILKLI